MIRTRPLLFLLVLLLAACSHRLVVPPAPRHSILLDALKRCNTAKEQQRFADSFNLCPDTTTPPPAICTWTQCDPRPEFSVYKAHYGVSSSDGWTDYWFGFDTNDSALYADELFELGRHGYTLHRGTSDATPNVHAFDGPNNNIRPGLITDFVGDGYAVRYRFLCWVRVKER